MALSVDRVSVALYEQWDPLGIAGMAPRDEYQDYAREIVGRVEDGEDVTFLAGYLQHVRHSVLMMPSDPERDRTMAEMIFAMRVV